MIVKIQISEQTNNSSVTISNRFSVFRFEALIEINENIQEKVRNIAITEVNSLKMRASIRLDMCKDAIAKRQNPKRFANGFEIYADVLFAIPTVNLENQHLHLPKS